MTTSAHDDYEPLFFFKLAITGRFRTGKDTLADAVRSCFREDMQQLITRLAFADALKRELAAMTYNWRKRGDDFERFVDWMNMRRDINGVGWQWWGEFRRQVDGEDFWVKHTHLQRLFETAQYHRYPMILTDMRHHNEAKWCKDNGFFRVRVEGPCRAPGDVRDKDHPSEKHISDLDVNLTFNNVYDSVDGVRGWAKDVLLECLKTYNDAWEREHTVLHAPLVSEETDGLRV